jgi:predicted AAA+ superfamily ATPase
MQTAQGSDYEPRCSQEQCCGVDVPRLENLPLCGNISAMIRRFISDAVLWALADRPVVFLQGARQTGKSTLVQTLAAADHPARYLTFDDHDVLGAARADPAGFIAGLGERVVLDEVQRAPEIFRAIKATVDRRRQPGRFLLTGSANILLVPHVSESLAGRMEILTLWPLSQGEIAGAQDTFVDVVFAARLPDLPPAAVTRRELLERVLRGGYPEVVTHTPPERRRAWFQSYITAILQRDVRDLANIEGLTEMPRLLALLAARACGLMNLAEVSRSTGIPYNTLKRYLTLLDTTFLIQLQPAWAANLGKRLVKAAKLILSDSGLLAHLLGVDAERLAIDSRVLGPLIENFVVMELRKQISWSRRQPEMFHFRTHTGQEVDIVLEEPNGSLVGVEVKASATIGADDFKSLRVFKETVGKRFRRGVLLHTGRESLAVGGGLHGLPVSALWQAWNHS